MSETPDRPLLRLLKFTPGRGRNDIGLTLSPVLSAFRRQSPTYADKIELALKSVIVTELQRWADQLEAENGGVR